MATTKSAKKPTKRDRHAVPVALTSSGELVAGKRHIQRYVDKNGAKSVLLSEWHHFGMLDFLRVARDAEGHLHICTTTAADEEGWDIVADEKGGRHGSP